MGYARANICKLPKGHGKNQVKHARTGILVLLHMQGCYHCYAGAEPAPNQIEKKKIKRAKIKKNNKI
jgi:hypothetical protein